MRNLSFGITTLVLGLLVAPPGATARDHKLVPATLGTATTQSSSGKTPAMDDFETLNFRGAAACSPCHGLDGSQDNPMSDPPGGPAMYDQWLPSIMAYGSKDPLWQAKVRSEVLRAPDELREFIEGKCSTCHTPMATTEAKKAGQPVLLFGEGFLDSDHPLHSAAMDGISCTLCHRIEDSPELGTDQGMSGAYTIANVEEPIDRPHYGRYEDTFDQPMRSSVGLLNTFGRQISDPALCATCHNLKTPYLDAAGNVAGDGFPEQTPFTEWQESESSKTERSTGCQGCHMPHHDEGSLASNPCWLPKRGRASHAFVSANTEILTLLAAEEAAAGGDPGALLASAEAGRELLTHAGDLEIIGRSFANGLLEFKLLVENSTGHKLPTAFPSRRVFLHVQVVRYSDGEIVFETGRVTDDGRIVGDDYIDDQGTFEPHHETITTPDQVQIYEAVLGNTDKEPTCTLLRASQYLKDNRLTPIGLDPLTAPDDVRPVGQCLLDDDFGDGADTIAFSIDELKEESHTVVIELRHQAVGWAYVDDLREFQDDPAVARFLDLYDAVLPGSELIAETAFEIGG